jgi:putative flippase GtrA
MNTFIRVQVASISGSLVDYLTTIIAVECFQWNYLIANGAGNILGGTLQFVLCKKWAFGLNAGNTGLQVSKFALVFLGNLLLSASGVYFLTHHLGINYLISKTLVSVFLGVTYNYYMQKKFVFIQVGIKKR